MFSPRAAEQLLYTKPGHRPIRAARPGGLQHCNAAGSMGWALPLSARLREIYEHAADFPQEGFMFQICIIILFWHHAWKSLLLVSVLYEEFLLGYFRTLREKNFQKYNMHACWYI